MTEVERAHRTRKQIAGVCMLVAPALLLLSAIIQPELETNEAAQLGLIADSADAWYVAQLLALGAIALALPAVLGFMHMLRERRVLFGHVGGGLALVGLLALTGAVYLVPFAFYAGVVMLAIGLALARAVHPLIAACMAVGAVLVAVGYPIASEILLIAGGAVLWLGVGATGWMVLRETDEQWEHTPQVSGFRPAGAH